MTNVRAKPQPEFTVRCDVDGLDGPLVEVGTRPPQGRTGRGAASTGKTVSDWKTVATEDGKTDGYRYHFTGGFIASTALTWASPPCSTNCLARRSAYLEETQTTRHRDFGIDTEDNHQTIYVGYPGSAHRREAAINRLMNRAATSSWGRAWWCSWSTVPTGPGRRDGARQVAPPQVPRSCWRSNRIDNVKEKEICCPTWVAGSADELCPSILPIQYREGHQRGEDPRVGPADPLPENTFTSSRKTT